MPDQELNFEQPAQTDDQPTANDAQTIEQPKVNTPQFEDLTDLLTLPTQRRDEVDLSQPEQTIDDTPVSIAGVAEFDTAKIEAIKSNTAIVADATTTISYDNEKLADAIIDLGDTILTHGAPYIYQSLLSKQERADLKQLVRMVREAKVQGKKLKDLELTADQLEASLIAEDIEKYEELAPLSEAEKNSIKKPLAEVLKNVNYQSTPQNALLMACGMIAIPRTIPLLPLLFKKKNDN
jgi:hypothetical protein